MWNFQALTGSIKERIVLKTLGREFLLLPNCSRVGSENQTGGRIGPDANRVFQLSRKAGPRENMFAPVGNRLAASSLGGVLGRGGKTSRGNTILQQGVNGSLK